MYPNAPVTTLEDIVSTPVLTLSGAWENKTTIATPNAEIMKIAAQNALGRSFIAYKILLICYFGALNLRLFGHQLYDDLAYHRQNHAQNHQLDLFAVFLVLL